MTPEFLSAVIDTLLPGDDAGVGAPASEASPPLPSATAAGVAAKLVEHLVAGRQDASHQVVLQAIASAAGGEEAFVRADAAGRIAAARRVEEEMRGRFDALVSVVLQDYYEAEPVLLAMGWRSEPPQPEGHVLPPFDDAPLAPVKRRDRMWR